MTLTAPRCQLPRLIIADDDPVALSVLDASLADAFDIVGMADGGEAAVDLARETQPDAALVDVEMPNGDGLRAVQGIHEVAPDTAIVVLSVDESQHMVRRLVQAGAIAYRRKGIAPQLLVRSLIESIDAHAATRQEHL